MKKRILVLLLACIMVLTYTACGSSKSNPAGDATSTAEASTPQGSDSTSQGSESTPDNVSLRFSWWGGDDRLAATLAVIDQFQELYPYVKIEPEYGSSDGYLDKLSTQLAAGTEPDIMQIQAGTIASLAANPANYFVDFLETGFDFSGFSEDFIAQPFNGRYNGKQVGIPTGIAGIALIVNEELANKIGIDFSQDYTWGDLIEWGKKVREYDDSLYLLHTDFIYLTNIVARSYAKQIIGTQIVDDATKVQQMTEEDWTKVFELVKQLFDNEVIAPASYISAYNNDELTSDPNWVNGKYVAAFTWVSTAEVLAAACPGVNFTAGKFPVMEGAKSVGYFVSPPQVMSVSSRSKNPKEAQMFLDYFFNDEKALETLGTTRSVPPTTKGREICTANGKMSKLLQDCAENASLYVGIADDAISDSTEGKQIFADTVEAVGFMSVNPEHAAGEMFSAYNDMAKNAN